MGEGGGQFQALLGGCAQKHVNAGYCLYGGPPLSLLHASVNAQCSRCHVPLSNLQFSGMFQNFLHCGNKDKIGMDNCGDGNSQLTLNALPKPSFPLYPNRDSMCINTYIDDNLANLAVKKGNQKRCERQILNV